MELKEWLHFDSKDLKADYLISIDQYIQNEIDKNLKEIAILRYYEKQTIKKILKEIPSSNEDEIYNKLKLIRNYINLVLKNKGWKLPINLNEYEQTITGEK